MIENIKQLDKLYFPNLCEMLKGKEVVYSALYSSFKIIENASHEVNIDNPEKLATLVQDFFEKMK